MAHLIKINVIFLKKMKLILYILLFFITLTLCGNEKLRGDFRSASLPRSFSSKQPSSSSSLSRSSQPSSSLSLFRSFSSKQSSSSLSSSGRGEDERLFDANLRTLGLMECFYSFTPEEQKTFQELFDEKIKYVDIRAAQNKKARNKFIRGMIDVVKEWTDMHPNLQRKLSRRNSACARGSTSKSQSSKIEAVSNSIVVGLQYCINSNPAAIISPDDNQNRESGAVRSRVAMIGRDILRDFTGEVLKDLVQQALSDVTGLECPYLLDCLCDIVTTLASIAVVSLKVILDHFTRRF